MLSSGNDELVKFCDLPRLTWRGKTRDYMTGTERSIVQNGARKGLKCTNLVTKTLSGV